MSEFSSKVKLNLGCGKSKLSEAINVDIESSVKPDVIADFRKKLPFEDERFEEVYLIHTIEHIQETFHESILKEIHRVLKPDGLVLISYPEFIKCAENYKNNYLGKRDFWKHTIYGRQLYFSDFHVALMDTDRFIGYLRSWGFDKITAQPEPEQVFNTFVVAHKSKPLKTYADIIKKEVWGDKK